MSGLKKRDIAVTLEAAGYRITEEGTTFLLNESAETFAAAWRLLNGERQWILEAYDRAGSDVEHQFDAAMRVIHELLESLGVSPDRCVESHWGGDDDDAPAARGEGFGGTPQYQREGEDIEQQPGHFPRDRAVADTGRAARFRARHPFESFGRMRN